MSGFLSTHRPGDPVLSQVNDTISAMIAAYPRDPMATARIANIQIYWQSMAELYNLLGPLCAEYVLVVAGPAGFVDHLQALWTAYPTTLLLANLDSPQDCGGFLVLDVWYPY